MLSSKNVFVAVMFCLLTICFLGGCVTLEQLTKKDGDYYRPERTVADYEKAGQWWGARHWQKLQPNQVDEPFVENLAGPNLDFFWVHSDLKNAFVKGYRLGYQERTADLVLGPNITAAAALIGKLTAGDFIKVINAFEKGWAETIKKAIDVFIVLISEGSQSDREKFIKNFSEIYSDKWDSTQKILKSGEVMTQMSEGGTLLYLDYTKGKMLGALDIPAPENLKTEIYHQTFKVMGDEWGRRLSHNLIKRDELIDLLRRSKTALMEVGPGLEGNLGMIRKAFIDKESYGTDAENVFRGLIKDAGYTESAISTPSKKR
jgi:hypothetical protein